MAKMVAREVGCSRGQAFLASVAEARGWISPGPPLHTCSGPLVGEAQCRARCRCARVRWFCHLGPFPRAPLDPQETGEFPKGNVSCRTPGIKRTPAKVRRRAASRPRSCPRGAPASSRRPCRCGEGVSLAPYPRRGRGRPVRASERSGGTSGAFFRAN